MELPFGYLYIPLISLVLLLVGILKPKINGEGSIGVIEIILGVLLFFLSINDNISNTQTSIKNVNLLKEVSSKNDTLIKQSNTASLMRLSDSISNAAFQKDLKDSFGILRNGNKAVVVNNIHVVKYLSPKSITTDLQEFKTYKNQQVFKTPGSPSSIKFYTVSRNGIVLPTAHYTVKAGEVTLIKPNVDTADMIRIQWSSN